MRVFLYLAAIVFANVLTAAIAPFPLGPFFIPTGTFLIGATFILRDLVQERYGRKQTYVIIMIALLISGISSYMLGDTLTILVASAISFVLSETTDTEIYTRLKLPMGLRVFWSGAVGGILDSATFVIIGLSPIGAGFLSWEMVPMAIAGQVLVKVVMQGLGAGMIALLPKGILLKG